MESLPVPLVKRLEAVYAQIPNIPCKRLCQAFCGPVPLVRLEHLRLANRVGYEPKVVDGSRVGTIDIPKHHMVMIGLAMKCGLLHFGECAAYNERPLVCRVWGVVERMACPHGCVPERWLTDDDVRVLVRELERIQGDANTWRKDHKPKKGG